MFYKSFSRILTFYGFSPQTSLSHFYANLLLVLSILNFIASFVYFKIAQLTYFNITDIITTSSTYILQLAHCVVLVNSVKNIGLTNKFYESLYEFDREIAVNFDLKVHQQAEVKLNSKILGGWIMSVVGSSLVTYDIIAEGFFLSLWLRVLPGILSIQMKYIHVFFYLELLNQRLEVYATVLDKMINEETTTEYKVLKMKKFYTKLIDIMDLVNKIFGTDLIFLVMHNFLDAIFNIYFIFLNGFYLHEFSDIKGINNLFIFVHDNNFFVF